VWKCPENAKPTCISHHGITGSVYAYVLNESPNAQVTVCARSNYKAVSEQGLDFQSEKFGNHPNYKFHNGETLCLPHFSFKQLLMLHYSMAAVATPSDSSLQGVTFKYIVATHKGIQASPTAAEQLKPVVGKDTTIVLIQNGVGVEEPFQAMYPNNTILSGVVSESHSSKPASTFYWHYALLW
jgi:2-dehydropantoate 2-reductase